MMRPGRCATAILGGQLADGPLVPRPRTRDLVGHQRAKSRARLAFQQVGFGDAMTGELVLRQIDAAAARVLADVTDDVRELEGDAEIPRVLPRCRVGVAEDFRRHESDDAGNAMAVALERGEIEIARMVEIHRHAVDHGLEMRLRKTVGRYDGC